MPKEFAHENWGNFMASNILKNNSFGGPTYFDRRGGPPAWAVDKRAELGWPSRWGKGWPAVCKSGPLLCSFTVCAAFVQQFCSTSTSRLAKSAFNFEKILSFGWKIVE